MNYAEFYKELANMVIESIENGAPLWQTPYIVYPHQNLVTGHQYRGMNKLFLSVRGFKDPRWLTMKQARENNTPVKAGEEHKYSKIIVAGRTPIKKDKDGNVISSGFPYVKQFNIYNATQLENVEPFPEPECSHSFDLSQFKKPICEIEWNDAKVPHYNSWTDKIQIPRQYTNDCEYFATLFHEIAHSTGHSSRLNRKMGNKNDSKEYAVEELIAEMCAASLCNHFGVAGASYNNSVSYLTNWANAIRANPKIVFDAVKQSTIAYEWLLGLDEKKEATND